MSAESSVFLSPSLSFLQIGLCLPPAVQGALLQALASLIVTKEVQSYAMGLGMFPIGSAAGTAIT